MDAPKTDLIVGLAGALVLTGLVVGLFAVGNIGEAPTAGSGDGTDGNETDPGDGPMTDWDNDTLSGTVPAGANLPDNEDAESSDSQTFDVPNGTYSLTVGFEPDASTPGDLDCHLYDANGTKLGGDHCHQGSADSPQGANFTLEVNASQWGEWTFEAHSSEPDGGTADLNSDKEYTVWISRAIRK